MLLLTLTLALSQLDAGVDGGSDAPIIVLDVIEGALVVRPEDGGTPEPRHVGDGCYLPTESCIRSGKEKARMRGERDEANGVGAKWIGLSFAGGALTGLAIGLVVGFTQQKEK